MRLIQLLLRAATTPSKQPHDVTLGDVTFLSFTFTFTSMQQRAAINSRLGSTLNNIYQKQQQKFHLVSILCCCCFAFICGNCVSVSLPIIHHWDHLVSFCRCNDFYIKHFFELKWPGGLVVSAANLQAWEFDSS